jgi:DnaJ-class molecular chaperone
MKDPYKVLGVDRHASEADVKSAYRRLAKKHHPDLHKGDAKHEQAFKEVTLAYGILGDAEKRKRYDRGEIDASGQETGWGRGFGGAGGHRRAERGAGGGFEGFDFGGGLNVEDILSDLFGGRARGGREGARRRGSDISYKATIDFLDAARGGQKRIRLSGDKTLSLRIRAGTQDGQTLRLKGQGAPGVGGGQAGDAYVEIQVKPHPHFTRKDNDINIEVPITLQEAVGGATITVPTIAGRVSMKVPVGANSGTTLRLKGKGVKDAKSAQPGDQYVRLRVVLPEVHDQELKDFVARWGAKHPYNPREKAGMD